MSKESTGNVIQEISNSLKQIDDPNYQAGLKDGKIGTALIAGVVIIFSVIGTSIFTNWRRDVKEKEKREKEKYVEELKEHWVD